MAENNEVQQRADAMNSAVKANEQDAKEQRTALDSQAEQEVAEDLKQNPPETTDDGTDAEFESWFADASQEAAQNVQQATGKSPDEYPDDEGAVDLSDLGLEDDIKEFDLDDNLEPGPGIDDYLNAQYDSIEETDGTEDSEEESVPDAPVPQAEPSAQPAEPPETIPVNGHFNVVSIGADYFNRLISVLTDRREAYTQQAKEDPTQGYAQAASVCADLIQVIMSSALRFTDTLGNPSVALTIQDEDMNNILVLILAATYDSRMEDQDYASQLMSYTM